MVGVGVRSSGWGGVLGGAHGTGYVHLLLVLSLCIYLRVCSGVRYSRYGVCFIILMSFHTYVCVSGWFSAVTDVFADYLSGFITVLP